MRKLLLIIPLAALLSFMIPGSAKAATINVSNLVYNTRYNAGDVIHNDTGSTFECQKSTMGGGAIGSISIPSGQDYTLECNYVWGVFNYDGFFSFICVPRGIQTLTVDEGATLTINKNDGYTIYDNGQCQLTYTWTELDENNQYVASYNGENISITDIQCSKSHHKFKMEVQGWSQMYDDTHRPPQMYFEVIVNHNEEHHHYPEPQKEDDSDTEEPKTEENKTEEKNDEDPSIGTINDAGIGAANGELGDNVGIIFNISLAITPGVFNRAIDRIYSRASENENVYLYSAWPITLNKSMLQKLSNSNKNVVYYFWHLGHLYSVTIPAKTDISRYAINNLTFAGPLYIGKQLGTSRLIK